jgi:hypothetical protein
LAGKGFYGIKSKTDLRKGVVSVFFCNPSRHKFCTLHTVMS